MPSNQGLPAEPKQSHSGGGVVHVESFSHLECVGTAGIIKERKEF